LALPPVSTTPGRDHVVEAAARDLVANQREQLLVARLDDLGERLARERRGGRSPTLGTSMVSSGSRAATARRRSGS
jgi:hypothetical protein